MNKSVAKKFKKFLFCVVVVASLLLLSCSGDKKQSQQTGIFLGGTEGLAASFEPFGIKEGDVLTMYDTEDFPLEVVLKNKGEEVVAPGKAKLRLLGPAQTDFENIPSWELTNSQAIDKKTEFNPEGGEAIVSFTPGALARYLREVTSFVDITWNVEYAYDYKTHVIVNDVCFKGDITDTRVCEAKGAKSFAVSGAPIQVKAITQDTGGKGIPLLKFQVENVGGGDATLVGAEFDNRFHQIGYVIDEPTKWECKSGGRENQARFVGNTAEIICKLREPLAENELYTSTLRFTLEYQYQQLATEKLRIKESVR